MQVIHFGHKGSDCMQVIQASLDTRQNWKLFYRS